MWQELSYLEMHTNLVEATTASTTLICLYFCLHISIQMFFTLVICFVPNDLLQSTCFQVFYSKLSIIFEDTNLLVKLLISQC